MTISVGESLRRFRLRQGLTLTEVSQRSGSRFTASSLGAYERNDRAITVDRLRELADVYGVDVALLFPGAGPDTDESTIDLVSLESRVGIVVDLNRFRVVESDAADAVMAFGTAIKAMRREATSSVLVVRRSDASMLAAALRADPARVDLALVLEKKTGWAPSLSTSEVVASEGAAS
jgi:transcriptional regulator with XRE-family HTH domain